MTGTRIMATARRLPRAAVFTRLRTRAQRWATGRVTRRPAAAADLGVERLDLRGLAVLDVGPPDQAVADAVDRAGAARTTAVPTLDDADGPADVIVLRALHRAVDPATTIWRLRELTGTLAIVTVPATEWPGHEQRGLLEILPGDATSPAAWSPSSDGMHELLIAAGFTDIRVVVGPPAYRRRRWQPVHYTLVIHAR